MLEVATKARESTMIQFPEENGRQDKGRKNFPLNHRNSRKFIHRYSQASAKSQLQPLSLLGTLCVRDDEDFCCFSKSR